MFSYLMSSLSLISYMQASKKTFEKRLVQATAKNIKTAILLSPGPVSSRLTTRSMSSAFQVAIKKANFMSAASQLQANGLGTLVVLSSISSGAHVFVKKTPAEMALALQAPENVDLCSIEEFEERFNMPPPAYINERIQEGLVREGLVPQEHFKERRRPTKKPSSMMTGFGGFPVP